MQESRSLIAAEGKTHSPFVTGRKNLRSGAPDNALAVMQWVRAMLKADEHWSSVSPRLNAATLSAAAQRQSSFSCGRTNRPRRSRFPSRLRLSLSQTSPKPFSRCSTLESVPHSLNSCFEPVKGKAPRQTPRFKPLSRSVFPQFHLIELGRTCPPRGGLVQLGHASIDCPISRTDDDDQNAAWKRPAKIFAVPRSVL